MPQVPAIEKSAFPRRRLPWYALVAVLAVVMGLPALRGGFVGGDDHRLVHDHLLVNTPSLEHAIQLFLIPHRDLYQPVPLLSFQLEFAIGIAFGIFAGGEGASAGAWLFHLDNVLLHAINAVLVLWLLSRLGRGHRRGFAVALVAALLFAVHPLQTEVVAWINGRMMLLSTLFLLASLIAFATWLENGGRLRAVLVVILVLLCALSKVRLGLPVLLLVTMFAGRRKNEHPAPASTGRPGNRRRLAVWGLWLACSAVMGVFVLLNIRLTAESGLFSGGAKSLHGPSIIRVLLALAFYFEKLVWPSGLASFYPAPTEVSFGDAATWLAVIVVAIAAGLLAWACRAWREARYGTIWFLATIFSTLPFMPARNTLAADRYMYLPIIGLLWLIATAATTGWHGLVEWRKLQPRLATAGVLLGIVIAPCVLTCWHVAGFYKDPVRKTQRIARLFPNTPHVWARAGWAEYEAGKDALESGAGDVARAHFARALEDAERELSGHDADSGGEVYRLMGAVHEQQGDLAQSVAYYQQSIDAEPASGASRVRLGVVYEKLGRIEEAIALLEQATERAPGSNVFLNRLAALYRQSGRAPDARAAYGQALGNNPFDVPANLGLAELDIETGNPEALQNAIARLQDVLAIRPRHAVALTNLGVAFAGLAEYGKAAAAYRAALAIDPDLETARQNLLLLDARGGATNAVDALAAGRIEAAIRLVEEICSDPEAGAARQALLGGIQVLDQQMPDSPWPVGLAARVLIAEGQMDAARAFTDIFAERCRDEQCRRYLRRLRELL